MTQLVSEDDFIKMPDNEKQQVLEEMKFMSLSPQEQEEALSQLQSQAEQVDRPGAAEAATRSFAQGLSFNFADEIEGVIRGGIGAMQGENFSESRKKATQESQERLSQGRSDFPAVSTAAEVGGGLLSLAIPGGAVARGAKVAKGLGKIVGEAGKTVVKAGAGGLVAGIGEHGIDSKTLKTAAIAGSAQIPAILAGKAANILGKSVVGTLAKVAIAGGSGLVGAFGTVAGTKLGKGLISQGAEILQQQGKKSAGFVKMVKAIQEGSEKLGNNSDKLLNAALNKGAPGLTAAHIQLIQQDKNYRKEFQ